MRSGFDITRRAATALALDSVPVIVREITDVLDAERILIASNDQREKTASERMHEADHLTRIIAEEARRRMLAGKQTDPLPTLAEGRSDAGFTRTQVAEAVGMKRSTYAKTKKVYDTAKDETVPEPVRTVGQQQMAALFLAEVGVPLAGLNRDVITAQERAETAIPQPVQEIGLGKLGPGRGHKTGDIVPRLRGNNADYLTARLARDHPAILARMRAGGFP